MSDYVNLDFADEMEVKDFYIRKENVASFFVREGCVHVVIVEGKERSIFEVTHSLSETIRRLNA